MFALSAVKSAGLNATWTETYTLEVPVGQGASSSSCQVMVYNKNLLTGRPIVPDVPCAYFAE